MKRIAHILIVIVLAGGLYMLLNNSVGLSGYPQLVTALLPSDFPFPRTTVRPYGDDFRVVDHELYIEFPTRMDPVQVRTILRNTCCHLARSASADGSLWLVRLNLGFGDEGPRLLSAIDELKSIPPIEDVTFHNASIGIDFLELPT